MLERNGRFTWPETAVYDGIRQSSSEATKRYRLIRNAHLADRQAQTKCWGFRQLNASQVSGGAAMYGGFDAHFQDGTQQVVFHFGTEAYLWASSTETLTAQGRTMSAKSSDMLLFADKLIVMDGSTMQSMTGAGTWTTITSAPAAEFGALHAERLCVAGIAGSEHVFRPSGIRDEDDWDSANDVIVETPSDPAVTNLGHLGHQLIVQTGNATLAYFLSSENPRDWDVGEVSRDIGALHHRAWAEVSRGRGSTARHYAFFWDRDEGPFMMTGSRSSGIVLVPLGDPIRRCIYGDEWQGMPAVDLTQLQSIQAVHVPEFNQVRFAFTKLDSSANDAYLAVDVDSAIAYAAGALEYPFWVLRDNEALGWWPLQHQMVIRVDTDGKPATQGQNRAFGGRNGNIYELDAEGVTTDDSAAIPFDLVRSGYSGREYQMPHAVHAIDRAYVHCTEVDSATLKIALSSDDGEQYDEHEVDLDLDLPEWDGELWDESTWTEGGDFIYPAIDFGINGRSFVVHLFDDGDIDDAFKVDDWTLSGFLEDRR